MRKLVLLVILTFSVSVCGAFATTLSWKGDLDDNWASGDNWDTGVAPVLGDLVHVYNANPCVVYEGTDAACDYVATGNNNVLTIKNGATLRASFGVSNTIYLANVGAANMVVENGAVVSADGGCFVGVGAGTSGVLTIQGGSLIVAGGLYVGFDSNSSGRVIIESGRAIVGALTIGPDDVIDIRGGTLSILHDVRHAVSSYVSQGNIVGYSGTGSVACIYEGDCTTVSATSGAAQSVSFDQEDQNFRKESREAIEGQIGGLDFDEVVFAVRQPGRDGHWYANFSHYCWDPSAVLYGDGGRLCALNIKTGKLRTLLEDPKGGVRDPQVHYDGEKILFSYRRGGQPYYHLYEINVDGSGLRQLTNGPYDDIEPSYLPDGGIIFCSSRVNCNVPCYYTRVAVLYRCDCDGSNIRRLSANVEHENTPWPMLDGRILYQRWEYVDRSQVMFHHLWTTNPDGTGQMVYFGNTHGGGAFLDAKPIPDSNKVVMIRSPGHGQLEHEGFVEFVHPLGGPDDRSSVRRITPLARWRDPYPISDKLLLVAGPGRHQISLLDHDGANFPVLTLPSEDIASNMWANEPRPIRSRLRERVIPSRVNLKKTTGTIILQDVYAGRNMTGVEPGDIKKLLVIEVLHMPVKPSRDWQQMVSFDSGTGGSFLLERIVGTVPVEEDGSAYFEAPAMRPLFFVALDEDNLSVKRMQSFTTVQPGERVSCIGCHEDRVGAPPVRRSLLATRRTASTIQPIADIPDVFDYPRDIQPILNKHCIPCHGYEKTEPGGPYAGKVLLSGERGIFYNQSYAALRAKRQVADGFNGPGNSAPRTIGTSASPLMKKLDGQHYGVQLSSNEKNMIRYWIESAGTFAGTYAALGKGFIIPTKPVVPDDVHTRRCVTCHEGELPFSKDDFRTHWFYNLDQPQKSVALLAPLAKAAGGWGMCTTDGVENGGSVFQDKTDPDHVKILAGIENLAVQLNHNKRYDMQGFEPHPAYTREMKAWGILPEDYEWSGYEDMFTTDRAYWESLQYRHEPLENEKH